MSQIVGLSSPILFTETGSCAPKSKKRLVLPFLLQSHVDSQMGEERSMFIVQISSSALDRISVMLGDPQQLHSL